MIVLVGLCGILIAFFLFVVVLWLIGRLCRAEKATFGRAAVVCGLSVLTTGLTFFPLAWTYRGLGPGRAIAIAVLLQGAPLFVLWQCTRILFHTRAGKAAFIGFTTLAIGVGAAACVGALAIGVSAVGFRATVVEAFVIPTGAMAPTLYGLHADKTCPQCGAEFAVSLSHRHYPDPPDEATASCDNCGAAVEVVPGDRTRSGDRILVYKQVEPRRWDLVVFYPPDDPPPDAPRPRYVMRLVGMPGERIEIREGDVWANGRRLRKPPGQLEELWLPVHDTTCTPPAGDGGWEPEAPTSVWTRRSDGCWVSAATAGKSKSLAFSRPISDRFSYNVKISDRYGFGTKSWEPPPQAVRDLKVDCDVADFRGPGRFGWIWRFGPDQVTAAVVAADGQVDLTHTAVGSEDAHDSSDHAAHRSTGVLPAKRLPAQLVFAVRDGQTYVMTQGRVVAALELPEPDRGDRAAAAEVAQQVAVFAEGCELTLRRIRLFRDIHYLSTEQLDLDPAAKNASTALADDEYFMLGDNSANSRDSRFYGPVPRASVEGVAYCRYWPPGRWCLFRP